MSAIGEALRTKLLSYNAVSTLVGQRMYPDALVQNAQLPAIVYYVTSTERDHAIDGVTKSAHARVTFDCYATTRLVASSISKAIRETGIDFFRGTVDGYSFAGIDFDSADEYLNDTPTDGNQEHRYLVSFDLLVHYGEP
jgi:hypothetical protein